jgi:GntR family transcriptional regulator
MAEKMNAFSIQLDTKSGVPFYRQIIHAIEQGVRYGKLQPGARLSTIRELAVQLAINPNTIAKAYTELELRGIVVTQVGSGTYIADTSGHSNEHEKRRNALDELEADVLALFARAEELDIQRKDLMEIIKLLNTEEGGTKHGGKE